MRRVGAIDIGTNTFLCLIADVEDGQIINVVSDKVQIVRLGEGVHKNRLFLPKALERAQACLQDFKKSLDNYSVHIVGAVATSAARDVQNAEALFKIGRALDIPIQTIPGRKEAELTYKGVLTNPLFGANVAVIDVGGGSTEVTFLNENKKIEGVSLDLGGVRLTEMFVSQHPTPQRDIRSLREYAKAQLTKLPKRKDKKLVGVAGTPTTIAALEQGIDYMQEAIEGFVLTAQTLEKWLNKLAALSLDERSCLKGLEPKRADIIVAGTAILLEVMQALGRQEMRVSTRGVRYGLAAELGS